MKSACLFLPIVLIVAPVAAHAQTADLLARVTSYNDAVLAVMKAKAGLPARANRFEPIVHDYYDMPAIAQLVVGAGWATAAPADRSAAIAALSRHGAITLARNFDGYAGEKFVVDPTVVDRGGSKIVRVNIVSSGRPHSLFYQMRESAGGWKIVDVLSDGISQIAAQRADFASTIAAGGAAGLARSLEKADGAVR